MIIFPAIDICQGKCVRLTQGDFNTTKQVAENPLETALTFEQSGAKWLHMVDLDGAKDAAQPNKKIFLELVKKTQMSIQLGGGIRNLNIAEDYLEAGVKRIIIGSAALKNPQLVKDLVKEYGERIAVGIDAKNQMVQTEGWLESSDVHYLDLAREMADVGVRYIIYTDISKDGTLKGPNLNELEAIHNAVSANIIASGGISNIYDIQELKKLGLYGAICGKSIYEKTLDLSEAIKIGNEG